MGHEPCTAMSGVEEGFDLALGGYPHLAVSDMMGHLLLM